MLHQSITLMMDIAQQTVMRVSKHHPKKKRFSQNVPFVRADTAVKTGRGSMAVSFVCA